VCSVLVSSIFQPIAPIRVADSSPPSRDYAPRRRLTPSTASTTIFAGPPPATLSNSLRTARALTGLLQRLDQEEDLRGPLEVHIRSVGEGAIAAAGDDDLEGLDEAAEAQRFVAGRLLLEK
jgi:hypothetical protein